MTEVKLRAVLRYLQDKGSGSKIDIFNATKYHNVGDAIFKLRGRGYKIKTTWHESGSGAKYAVYVYVKNGGKK